MENIERKLESAFGKKNDLDSRLQSASSHILTQKIEFMESSKPHSSVNSMLKDKYINLAPGSGAPVSVKKSPSNSSNSSDHDGEGLPHPKVILFREPLNYEWDHFPGSGLVNCGNTCFLNAVLQCLIHTPPLTNYLISSHHTSECQMFSHDRCIMCNLEFLTKRCLSANQGSITPKWFTNNLQYIGRHFRCGRQEDAHEFLRLSLEKMQKCALYGQNHLDKYSKETTVVNQIFGGFLRSQVQCVKCGHKSNTYDPLLDISLDIRTVNNLLQALSQFVVPDKLDAENAYKCERCKQKVTAFKRFTIHKAPKVLTIQLKRFQYGSGGLFGGGGSKIMKQIQYPFRLDLRPYMSNKNGPPMIYSLIGSIQHQGYACTQGHYTAHVRCGDQWYNFNDSVGILKSVKQILNDESAYILFYMVDVNRKPQIGPELKPKMAAVKEEERKQKKKSNTQMPSTSTFTKPLQPVNNVAPHTLSKAPYVQTSFRTNGFPSNEIGEKVKSPLIPLSANREKIRINLGVKTKTPEKHKPAAPKTPVQTKPSSPPKSETGTPRLVVKIKDGKSITIETSPDGERRILSDDDEVIAKMNEKKKKYVKRSSIVPYADDSDSDWSAKEASPKLSTSDPRKEHSKDQVPSKHDSGSKHGVVLDRALNTTTSVPGNAHLFNTVSLKDKVSHTHHHDRTKDIKMFSPKAAPVKRELTESLSCSTSPLPAKHSGTGEWHTSAESVLSPSVGSNHSNGSNQSNSSTQEWAVLNGKLSASQERKHDGWTVTENKKENENGKYVIDNNKNVYVAERKKSEIVSGDYSSPYTVASDTTKLLKMEKPKDKNSEEYREYKRLKKLRKKHKKKHRDDDEDHDLHGGHEDTGSHSFRKKKKKHKKDKHRDRDERHSKHHCDEDEDPIPRHSGHDEERHRHKHREQKHRHRDEGKDRKRRHEIEGSDRSYKRHRQNSESSTEFEWVEKTTDNPVPARASVSEPVTPSHRWDHYIKDGYQRKSTSGSSTPVVSTWDGLKHSSVVQELEKVSSYGYGAPVSGWDGQKSQLDIDRGHSSRKRKESDDEYDDDYDKGKVKKVKHKHHSEHRYNGNLFQEKQDELNRSKLKMSSIMIGNNNPFKSGQTSAAQRDS